MTLRHGGEGARATKLAGQLVFVKTIAPYCHNRFLDIDPCASVYIRGKEFDWAVEKLLSRFGTKADIVTSAILDDN
jgi:hypothetical protein